MKIDLIKLVYNQIKTIPLDFELRLNSNYFKETEIKELSTIKVNGEIYKDSLDKININIDISGQMKLLDGRSLEEVWQPFSINFNENLEENYEIKQNILDIEPILWENIVLEVPISVISDKPVPKSSGNGWELKDDE